MRGAQRQSSSTPQRARVSRHRPRVRRCPRHRSAHASVSELPGWERTQVSGPTQLHLPAAALGLPWGTLGNVVWGWGRPASRHFLVVAVPAWPGLRSRPLPAPPRPLLPPRSLSSQPAELPETPTPAFKLPHPSSGQHGAVPGPDGQRAHCQTQELPDLARASRGYEGAEPLGSRCGAKGVAGRE